MGIQLEPLQYLTLRSMEEEPYKTIAVGNPGCGKSTYLNALAGHQIFKSGINIGSGLTYKLDEGKSKDPPYRVFLDTPGLADQELREKAGKAISEGLRKGGEFKVIFFVTESRGRVQAQDATTMKLVLEAAPEIGQRYGVIVNMVGEKVLKRLQDENEKMKFLTALFVSIPLEQRCVSDQVAFFPAFDHLEEKESVVVSPETLVSDNGMNLLDFLENIVPKTIPITSANVKDIDTDKFDKLTRQLEEMAIQMQKKDEEWKNQMMEMEKERNELAAEMRSREQELERQRNQMYEEMRKRDDDKKAEMRELERTMDRMALDQLKEAWNAKLEREKDEQLRNFQNETNEMNRRMEQMTERMKAQENREHASYLRLSNLY